MTGELEKLYSHIDDIEIAMMTTRRADGHLQSRAMATQKRAAGADLWFVTLEDTQKLRDLAADPHVNLSYYKDGTREWISVSGIVTLTRAREKIHELYAPDWKAWFPKASDPRHGTKDDPRMVLIGVTAGIGFVARGVGNSLRQNARSLRSTSFRTGHRTGHQPPLHALRLVSVHRTVKRSSYSTAPSALRSSTRQSPTRSLLMVLRLYVR
jgi:general stress protein 26